LKAAVFMGLEDIRVADVPKPEPKAGEVLIKVAYCGICGSDVAAYRTGNYVEGLVIGHEFSGYIEEVGEGVEGFKPGDRVTGNGAVPCGCCKYCLTGKPSQCEDLQMTGVTFNGAMAEYIVMPAKVVYKLPDSLSMLHATLVDTLADVLHAYMISSLKAGDTVLVQGAGPIGACTVEVAELAGASKIIVSEPSPGRRRIAEELGAHVTVDPTSENLGAIVERETGGEGVDIVFDAAGVPASLSSNFTLVKKGGEIVVIGICEEPFEADFFTLVLNQLTVKGSYLGYNEYPLAIKLLAEGEIDADKIITSVIPLEDVVERGFKRLVKPTDECKIVVELAGE